MTSQHPNEDFRRRLKGWLDDGPTAVPHEDLLMVLEATQRTAQHGRAWRLPTMLHKLLPIGAAAAAVLIVALAWIRLSPATQTVGGPSPSAVPSATPGWQDRFPAQSNTRFTHPFQFAIDPASRIQVDAGDLDIVQYNVPDADNPESFHEGVSVQLVRSLRNDYCAASGGSVISSPSPQQFVTYMRAVPGLEVTEPVATTVDGRDALQIDVTKLAAQPCADGVLHLWGSIPFAQLDPGWHWRITAFEVDGDTVLTFVRAADNIEAFLPTAQAFIDTLHFPQ